MQATIKDQRAVLTWDHQALTAGRISIRRLGYPVSFPPANYVGGTATTSVLVLVLVLVLVPGARYQFRVQFVRGRIATPFGPIATITARRTRPPVAVGRVVLNGAGIRWTRSPTATHYLVSYRRAQAKRWVQNGGLLSAPRGSPYATHERRGHVSGR